MTRVERLRKLNKDSYSEIAGDFYKSRQNSSDYLIELASHVAEGDTVLDLGCGNGRLLKAMPNVNYEYLGIDSNEYLLSQASKEFPGKKFQQADIEDVQLGNNKFDSIFCISTFHHLVSRVDRLTALRKCFTALKPDGDLFLTVWNLWQGKYFKYLFSNIKQKQAWNDMFVPWRGPSGASVRYYHCFLKHELRRLLKQAGFKNVSIIMKEKAAGKEYGYNFTVHAIASHHSQ